MDATGVAVTPSSFPRSTVHGLPSIGADRELKRATEGWWAGRVTEAELDETARRIRRANQGLLSAAGIDIVPSNDFSPYDRMLDTAVMVGAVPERYRHAFPHDARARYYAMARGAQGEGVDLAPLAMTKWFDTNYHHLVPELDGTTTFELDASKPLHELAELTATLSAGRPAAAATAPPAGSAPAGSAPAGSAAAGSAAGTPARVAGGAVGAPKVVLVGPVTFLLLSRPVAGEGGFDRLSLLDPLLEVYGELLAELRRGGATWVQLDEPVLVQDRSRAELDVVAGAYRELASVAVRPAICVSTYFDHAGDALGALLDTPVDGIGLDFCGEGGPVNRDLVRRSGGFGGRALFAGVVDGRSVWRTPLGERLALVEELAGASGGPVVVSTSCSLQHVPVTVAAEERLDPDVRSGLAFAAEKVAEVAVLARGLAEGRAAISDEIDAATEARARHAASKASDPTVRSRVEGLGPADSRRAAPYEQRRRLQAEHLGLPPFPTTTIGSFPQTTELRRARAEFGRGGLSPDGYDERVRAEVGATIALQERLGLDVLVTGEPERNDMVQFFAERLRGFVVTDHGWVQSYGTRCTRPPVVVGDVSRPAPMTVALTRYAQSLTDKPVKGMLTGPVTMLEWSFPRDDVPRADSARQIALAIRDEVADLEAAGIRVVQVDEPAFREGLPLRVGRRDGYLAWATECFRLATAGAGPAVQVHTHMCYSEFGSILDALGGLDVDVISFEAARSHMEVLGELAGSGFDRDVGPGVYDIHSPRVPGADEIAGLLGHALGAVPPERLWVNPDCGLKTRRYEEATPALEHMVEAARRLRVAGAD